jgi:class 3 adenylate cyclase
VAEPTLTGAKPDLRAGTVTFLFTDIEGSTRLAARLRDGYGAVLAAHQRLLREAFAGAHGQEIDTQGDSFFVAFARAKDAVAAAIAAQRGLAAHPWPAHNDLRVRIGIHTADPEVGADRYVGLGVHRAARICAAAHGGQILVSNATRELVEDDLPESVELCDLGAFQLKDLERPERIYQVAAPDLLADFPPLRTSSAEEGVTAFVGREDELADAVAARGVGTESDEPPGTETPPVGPARPFVGREQELAELRSALDLVSARRGSVFLITGEPGIGKTRLMQEVAGVALDQGWRVLVGRCWEEGGAPAYWPWIQVVRAAGGEFERLAAPIADSSAPGGADPDSVRFRLFDAATRFLLGAARLRPLVIVLEDLHAADVSSLLLLRFLGEAIDQSPILVLGSYREGETRVHEQGRLFGELVRVSHRILLRGLSVDEVETYAAGVVGDSVARSVASRLHAITGGNPFFLGELVRLLSANGLLERGDERITDPMLRVPEEVRTLIRRRVAGLSPEAMSTLRVAAVIGRGFDLRVLEHISHLSTPRLLDVLAEATEAGALVEAGTRYSFVHELVRETLYEDLPASRRRELHLTLGRVLEELSHADVEEHLSEIAHHLALAAPLGDPDTAVEYLVRAGDRASTLLAYEEAALDYGRALELLDAAEDASAERRGDLLLRLGDSQWRAGDARAARSSFEQATEAARRLSDADMLARAALGHVTALGGFLLFARFEIGGTGAGLLEEALAALPEADSSLRARLLARLAVEMYSANEPVDRRVALSGEAMEMARRLDDSEALVTAFHARHWALTTPELVQERLAHSEEMLQVARETGNWEAEFLAHNSRFHCLLELCDGRAMDAEIEAMTQIAELIRQPFYLWHTVCLRAVRATLDGRFDDAEQLAREALEIGRLRQTAYFAYMFRYAQLFAIRWAQGRLPELWGSIRSHSDRFPWIPRWRDAIAAAELGDEQAARAEIERHAARDFADLPRDGLWILHLSGLAQCCVLARDERRGELLYELLLQFADRNAVSYTQQPFGPVALRLAGLAAMLGRWDDAEQHFEAALECCRLLGARAIGARVVYEFGAALLERGRPSDKARAAVLLDESRSVAGELGITGSLERIDALAVPTESARSRRTPEAIFRREGDFWTIAYSGKTFRLRDVKGLRYLALLLGSPGKEIHVLELAQAANGLSPNRERATASAAEPVLDAQAKETYRRRLEELGEDLQEARDWSDPERVAGIEEEIEALTDELARAAGLGGRDRELPSPAERARVSVTKAIRSAIKAIERHNRELGGHLAASIHTGRFCSYAPPGEKPPRWTF